MIPIYLAISGFLSYHEPTEIDFTAFELACISGANGAGKSSLLDAITWALFGQARKRDDSLINSRSSAAQVELVFAYEGNFYRVIRHKPREKTALLEFHILQDDSWNRADLSPAVLPKLLSGAWKPLTERTLRETEARIQSILRMDYETFTNASFFLQGKADQFTQQRPGDRKRILSSILGLDAWEAYRQRASERRRSVESDLAGLDGQLREIQAELSEETPRKARLAELEASLNQATAQRKKQEQYVQNARQAAAALAEQARLVEMLQRQAAASRQRLGEIQQRLTVRSTERDSYAELMARAGQIEHAYQEWRKAQADLERWERIAEQFREQEKRRDEPRLEIQNARIRLEQDRQSLLAQQEQDLANQADCQTLQVDLQKLGGEISFAEARLARRAQLEEKLKAAMEDQAEASAENPRLKAEMEELKERIERLSASHGAACPLCGQVLDPAARDQLVLDLGARGRELGNRYRNNLALLRQAQELVADLKEQINALSKAELELRALLEQQGQLNARLQGLREQHQVWLEKGALRLAEIELALQQEVFALEARARLAQIDAELQAIGYDARSHDAARQAELQGRTSRDEERALQIARAALAPLEREIADLQAQLEAQARECEQQEQGYQHAANNLATAQAQTPDLFQAERDLLDAQEMENRLRLDVGAARQKVLVLEDLKARQQQLEAQRDLLAHQIYQYKQLERAFSKDGVPALLIEQALPEIENKANDILSRLSGGAMSVRFVTQAAYKDRNRDDLRETLDIRISDSLGTRDYEMYSGGEAFRANFAVRLALAEVLAQRSGARLQTLVIDEGFGSQDALGRQRLVEAINLVRQDFAKILVITHIDELKDAFPARLEVEKTDLGSTVRLI